MGNIELNEKEKWALYQCDDGAGFKEAVANEKLEISEEEAEKILDRLNYLGLISFDFYKDKDLRKYQSLKTEGEIENFKRENHASYEITEKGKKHLSYNSDWE